MINSTYIMKNCAVIYFESETAAELALKLMKVVGFNMSPKVSQEGDKYKIFMNKKSRK